MENAMTTHVAREVDLQRIPLGLLHESPLNTRKHFDPAKLADLATSMKGSGQLTPLLARPSKLPKKPGFELASGHRRRRAAELAGIAELTVIVKDLDDRTFLEILTIDNLQREDVHPLEEAQGYRNLLTIDGYDIKQIAERVGKSESYVYDRMKLLQLTPAAQELFFANRFTLGHAILLARIPAADQEHAIETTGSHNNAGGLWRGEGVAHPTLDFPADRDDDEYAGLVPRSVRELQAWIDTYVRFDTEDEAVPQLFPNTAATLAQAETAKDKVIAITRDYHVQPGAKDPEGARTYGPTSWKRANGQPDEDRFGNDRPSKVCEHSVVGVVAVGEGRGDSFRVCVDKKRCTVHWGDEIRERNKRERARENAPASPSTSAGKDASPAAAEAKRKAEQAAREVEHKRWEKAMPSVLTALGRAVKSAPANSASPIAKFVWKLLENGLWGLDSLSKTATKYVPRGVSSSDFLAHIAMCALVDDCENNQMIDVVETAKELKLNVDVAKIVNAVSPRPEAKLEPKNVPGSKLAAESAKSAKSAKKAPKTKKKATKVTTRRAST
ncbi:MAG: Chromosome (plasmid) partitioning protein ParB [Gemmatimonadetes bacterium]|nr:Chromosome (plasmid) partitioning protein ParB [Gemmatimonadota bacterium]